MTNCAKLENVYSSSSYTTKLTDSIINSIVNSIGEYTADDITAAYSAHSGNKLISSYLENGLEGAELFSVTSVFGAVSYHWRAYVSAEFETIICNLIVARFSDKWAHLRDIYGIDYNPIYNYNMEETTIESGTQTGTVTTSGTGTGTSTDSGATTETETTSGANTGTVTTSNTDAGTINKATEIVHGETIQKESEASAETAAGVFGFNSESAVDQSSSTGSNTITETDTHSGTDSTTETETRDLSQGTVRTDDLKSTDTREATNSNNSTRTTDSSTSGTRTDDLGHTVDRSISRIGNIGVTTTQQMLQSEIDLWSHWDYLEVVFDDIDKVLTCPLY